MAREFGIDVSVWQAQWEISGDDWVRVSNIAWKVVKETDLIKFAYIKTSEGLNVDPMFLDHVNGVESINLPWGGYHYYIPTHTGSSQAYFAHSVMRGTNPILDPVFDLECPIEENAKAIANSARSYCETLSGLTNKPTKIYTRDGYLRYLVSLGADIKWMKDFPLWLAWYTYETDNGLNYPNILSEIQKMPLPKHPWPWDIGLPVAEWQFSGHGRLPYVGNGKSDIDLNIRVVDDPLPPEEIELKPNRYVSVKQLS
jgi:GH25 family lysozyme M1 (1,4-beta-N-acetylmuramidase)